MMQLNDLEHKLSLPVHENGGLQTYDCMYIICSVHVYIHRAKSCLSTIVKEYTVCVTLGT